MPRIYAQGKVVGSVEDGILRKRVNSKIHFLKIPPAIALDAAMLQEAVELGASEIEIYDRDSDVVFSSSVDFFRENSFPVNRGFGEQLAMPIERWRAISSQQPELF